MGRRPKPIDEDQLFELAKLGCTQDEAASVLGLTQEALSYRLKREPLKSLWERGFAEAKVSLRRRMLDRAMNDANPAPLIFLAKQKAWLGMSDRIEKDSTSTVDISVRWVAVWGATPASLGMDPAPQLNEPPAASEAPLRRRLALPPAPEPEPHDEPEPLADPEPEGAAP